MQEKFRVCLKTEKKNQPFIKSKLKFELALIPKLTYFRSTSHENGEARGERRSWFNRFMMSGYNTRSRRRAQEQHTDEGTAHDSELDLPRVPLHENNRSDDEETMTVGQTDTGLARDKYNIAVLLFLYVLQGIPLGLAGSIPYLLQSRHVSYKEQAVYSFVFWPFSVKLLWAPIVDAAYFKWFGRRKSWLVPIQYLIGFFMLVLSLHIKDLMGEGDSKAPICVKTLTVVFFMLNFLAATQDIAVDGWALTMLAR